ncbi:hypothetical protein K461DRAFT_315900 [Myriangium duriaei CBS 260.36]|uniref:Rhodopsin domain-containing protein n=1 Tax=Myriangium duriaei CBS 260.36 TaxID=1168546 RepID=A0A9P4IV19_9PEZI|nr:hypothetical protein K461DRAFT_315900 [Myriangium duriaei CBS 260.36]
MLGSDRQGESQFNAVKTWHLRISWKFQQAVSPEFSHSPMAEKHDAYGGMATVMLAVTWPQAVIATILVMLRAYAASTKAGKLRWDFILVAVGTLFGIAAQIHLQINSHHGLGSHLADVGFDNLWVILHLMWSGVMVGLVGITLAKLSIVALLLSITPFTQPVRRGLLWTAGGLMATVNFIQIPITLTQCEPLPYLWNRAGVGSCPRATMASNFGYFQGAIAITCDVFLALYPSMLVWTLKVSHRTKIGFCFLMAGGLFPATAAIIRNVYLKRLTDVSDISYTLSPFIIWAMTEMWMVVILGSIPPLRPLFERVVLRRSPQNTVMTGRAPVGAGGEYGVHTIGSMRKSGMVERTTEVMVTVAEGGEVDMAEFDDGKGSKFGEHGV